MSIIQLIALIYSMIISTLIHIINWIKRRNSTQWSKKTTTNFDFIHWYSYLLNSKKQVALTIKAVSSPCTVQWLTTFVRETLRSVDGLGHAASCGCLKGAPRCGCSEASVLTKATMMAINISSCGIILFFCIFIWLRPGFKFSV